MNTTYPQSLVKGIAIAMAAAAVAFSCQKNGSGQSPLPSDDAMEKSVMAQAMSDSAMPPYNLNAVMRNGEGGFGFVKFRQNPDTARIIDLNTWLFNLKPNHVYLLQRAVNPITDTTECSSTAWLTLGLGLVPQSIHTDKRGYGHEDLFRDITSLARGTEFYIHFQVIDSLTSETVLTSDCHTYTVR